jgi:hypothetical protein
VGRNRREEGFICQTPVTTKGGNTTFFWEERITTLWDIQLGDGKVEGFSTLYFSHPFLGGKGCSRMEMSRPLSASPGHALLFNNGFANF